jgi:hypothetical protein
MRLSLFLFIKAIIAAIFGIAILLAPAAVASLYGMAVSDATVLMARLFAIRMIGTCLICWFLRWEPDTPYRRGLLLALFVQDGLGLIVTLAAVLGGTMNALGWLNVAIWLFLAVGLAYFRFVRPNA